MSQGARSVPRMLRLIAADPPGAPAYRVPFEVERVLAPRFTLHNRGSESLHGVTLTLLGDGRLLWGLPTALDAGGSLQFVVRADDPARNSVLVVRWFRPNGDEYLWRVAF